MRKRYRHTSKTFPAARAICSRIPIRKRLRIASLIKDPIKCNIPQNVLTCREFLKIFYQNIESVRTFDKQIAFSSRNIFKLPVENLLNFGPKVRNSFTYYLVDLKKLHNEYLLRFCLKKRSRYSRERALNVLGITGS